MSQISGDRSRDSRPDDRHPQGSNPEVGARRRVAVYPGTFDPFHNGHLDVALRAGALFDELIVAVYERPAKALLFSAEERVALARASLEGAAAGHAADGRILVGAYSELSVQYARARGACAMVRGLRTGIDFEYEYGLTLMNRHLAPEVETVFLVTAAHLGHLSATLVKEVAAGGAPIREMVPPPVAEALLERLGRAELGRDGA